MDDRLKLFVVGALSADPHEWSEYGSRTIVIAHDEAEANRLCGDYSSNCVTEIKFDKAVMLMREEHHGEF